MTNTQHNTTTQNQPATLQEQLHIILAASTDGIALINAHNHIIEANKTFSEIFGIDPSQLIGMDCIKLLYHNNNHAQAAERTIDHSFTIQQSLQQRHALPNLEIDLNLKGQPRILDLSITPLATASQPLSLLIVRDITAIRETARLKSNFLSMITHELRSPLNSIHGYLDLALTGMGGDLNEQQREFVQRARSSSEHLYALIEDLLLISRADSGQARLTSAIVSLPEIVANAIEELELTATDNAITIIVNLPHDFPPIYADAVRIQQVLRNLINNALRFTPSGGTVTITATTTDQLDNDASDTSLSGKENKLLKVEVSDTGPGIVPEQQQRIFERFYQIPQPTSGRTSGLGLGLAIVQMIVELHGGHVTVTSTQEQTQHGSTFTCLLPCLLT